MLSPECCGFTGDSSSRSDGGVQARLCGSECQSGTECLALLCEKLVGAKGSCNISELEGPPAVSEGQM